LLPIKLHIYLFLVSFTTISICIVGRGVDVKTGMPENTRKKIKNLYQFFCDATLLTSGVFGKGIIKKTIDYSEYLGKGYSLSEEYGTVVCNHSTPLDTTIMGHLYECKMVSKAGLKSVPYVGRGAELLETIFVD